MGRDSTCCLAYWGFDHRESGPVHLTIQIEPANETVAAELAAIPAKVLVVLFGDLLLTEEYAQLTVKDVELLHLPYTAQTPLDSTFRHPDLNFAFDYPSGWSLRVNEYGAIFLDNVWQEQFRTNSYDLYHYAIFFRDPTSFCVTVRSAEAESAEELIAERVRIHEEENLPLEMEPRIIGDYATTRLIVRSVDGDDLAIYVVELNELVLTFSCPEEGNSPFIERVISTLRRANGEGEGD